MSPSRTEFPVIRTEGKRVACLGECMIELVTRPDGLLSRGFGGDTLNTTVYLARLGVPVDYVTALGTDPFSDEMVSAWEHEGIGTALVVRVPGRLPGLYLIETDAAGERRFSYWRDSAPVRQLFELPEASSIEAALTKYGLVYLSGITLSLFDEASRERLFAILDGVRAHGGRVAFDTNFRPRGWLHLDEARTAYERAAARSDIILASVEDHALLYGIDDVAEIVARYKSAGISEIVLKLATPGCIVYDGRSEISVPAETVTDVLDTTAAGDSFAAAYLAARYDGASVEAAARAGHALAATVVRYRGAIIPRAAMPENAFAIATPENS